MFLRIAAPDRPQGDIHLEAAAKDWLPADVVPTSALAEGTAVLATQSLSDELLKTLPKAVPWRNNEGRRFENDVFATAAWGMLVCWRMLQEWYWLAVLPKSNWTVYRDCRACGSIRCLF